jgi:hypothetical protein
MKAKSLKLKLIVLYVFSLVFTFTEINAQNCSSLSGVINTYAPVTAISGNVVTRGTTTGAAAPFAVGDYVVLIQMTGPPPPQTGSNMGKYELRKVTLVSGTAITLDGIVNSYTTSEKVQLVRVPNCPTANVSGTVTARAWDGTTGGILALKGTTLTLNADIDASATGFSQANFPTYTTYTSLSSGLGSTDGRGKPGSSNPGGGLGGGGGASTSKSNAGGGLGGSGSVITPGTNGGASNSIGGTTPALSGGGGGGGIIGGGGGGAGDGSGKGVTNGRGGGNGGGVAGGGAGGVGGNSVLGLSDYIGGGGGGVKGVGMGINASCIDGCSGSGGGSYGGGGGAASAFAGGDDSYGGGGGGSWTGGGIAGKNGTAYTIVSSGAGNDPVSVVISDSEHYLNTTDARIMMGGAGGSSTCQPEGFGGGIIILNFTNVSGNSKKIIANGESKGLAPYCSQISNATGAGGAGGGGGGQIILNVENFTSSTIIEAKGGKGGDGNNAANYHGGTGGAGGGGGGIWVYGTAMSTNTGGETVNVANTNLIGTNATSSGVSGGSAGATTLNPKNGDYTGTGGAGGNGLIIQSPTTPSWDATCLITLTAIPGSCTPSTNTYGVTGTMTFTDAPSTGTLTVTDGTVTETYPAPFTSPMTYTLSGIAADGASHTVTAVFSADPTCTNTVTYMAPVACGACTLSLTATAGACVPSTNTYSVTGNVSFTNAPSTGSLTISVGSVTSTYPAPFTSPLAYTVSGLIADGASHTAVAGFSANASCTNMSTYTAPAACTPACSVSLTAVPGSCNIQNNQYFISGVITFSNAPTMGTLVLSVSGGGSQTLTLPQVSPLNYTINGLNSDGANHTVTVTFSDNAGCTATTNYTSPVSCSAPCPPSTYSMCVGESYTLTAPSGYSGYQWYTVVGLTETPISGATSNTLVVTSAGTYIWKATDGSSCPIELCCPVTIEIVAPIVNCTILSTPGCGQSNGSATVSASGGSGVPYTYVWSTTPAQTSATVTNIPAGTYTVTVTDGGMCTATCSVILSNPGGPMAMISNTSPGCGQSNGSATVTANGGTSPYTYIWSTTPVQSGITATGLSAGTYTVTVVDNTNCSVTISTTLVNPNGPSAICSNTAPGCGLSNGTATVSPSGGTGPYSYTWSTSPVQTGITATGLTAGTYTVTVTDNNNCSTTCNTTLVAPGGPTCTLVANTQPSCSNLNGGSVTVTGAGGTSPYNFAWSNGQSGPTATGMSGGVYTVTVTDVNNCSSTCTGALTTPTNCCNINAIVPQNIECLDNSTPSKITDNRIRFSAQVTNTNASLTGYNVTINGGTTITPNTNVAYGVTQFTLGIGTAGSGTTYTITVTDSATPGCTQTFQVTDPGNCTPATPECPQVKCGTATIQVNGN